MRENSKLFAGVPVAIRTVSQMGVPITVAEIVGTGPVPTRGMGLADKADIVVRRDAPEAGKLLTTELAKLLGYVDVLALKGVDSSSPTGEFFPSLAAARHSNRVVSRSVSPYISLPRRWEEYLHLRSRNFREQLKKKRRVLHEAGRMQINRLEPEDDCAPWMAEVVSVDRRSWSARRGTNLYRHPAIRAFFLELVLEMANKGLIDLHLLRLDGKAIAYELCFNFEGRVFSYNRGFDADMGKLSPGMVLTATVIEDACQRGRLEYDLLRGGEDYKFRWTHHYRRESEVIVLSGTLRSRIYASLGLHLKRRLKSWSWIEKASDRATGLRSRLFYQG
ncbi:MAG: GNAT family N-acetyltransferase [candidate division Zixibacteria bacterium]|nr:GNAT family N-acetyltransferase [candidate division Zixibacteria bacterium]